jgi:hypothetical protein
MAVLPGQSVTVHSADLNKLNVNDLPRKTLTTFLKLSSYAGYDQRSSASTACPNATCRKWHLR